MQESKKSFSSMSLPADLKDLSVEECQRLCTAIRRLLIKTVADNGGHLASNLGTVELGMALHRVFNSPEDKIVWDVGHQAYTHKILTGRYGEFATIRQEGGISGFPTMSESEHDAFTGGHSSNSISAVCGIAQAMKLQGKTDNYAVAVIGDGALTGGLAYEGLNNAGKIEGNIIVILNQNDMSISKNVGGLAKYLSNIRGNESYLSTKNAVSEALSRTPVVGKPLAKFLKGSKTAIKKVIYKTTMFEDLGFVYLGTVDGHNLSEIEATLRLAKNIKEPVFVHVNTVKGKGFKPAENNPGAFHGISSQDVSSLEAGNPEIISDDSYSAVFGKALTERAAADERICAITAAMKYGTGLQYFAAEHKDRFFDVGIAEEHAVTFAAGLSSMGMLPVLAVYSTFLQRAYDQLIHDVAIGGLHVVLAVDRAGVVGEDGETHQGLFDVPMLCTIPNTTVFSPACYEELRLCLDKAMSENGLACVRYPRGNDCSVFDKAELNCEYTLQENGGDILLVTYGRIYDNMLHAAEELGDKGIICDTLRLTRIFPVADEIIEKIRNYRSIYFFEESEPGGISAVFAERLINSDFRGRYRDRNIRGFVKHASVGSILHKYGLDTEGMIEFVEKNEVVGDAT